MKRLSFALQAERELQSAARRYEQIRAGLGVEFLQAVELLLRRVARDAQTFPRWRDNLPFRKAVMIRRFPFVVFFQDRENEVWVFAVAHSKRRPGYWLRRTRHSR